MKINTTVKGRINLNEDQIIEFCTWFIDEKLSIKFSSMKIPNPTKNDLKKFIKVSKSKMY